MTATQPTPPRRNRVAWDEYHPSDLLDPEHFELLTGVAKKTQENLRARHRLPFLKIGGRVVYRVRDIQEWFDRQARNQIAA